MAITITQPESHQISVLAGQGEVMQLRSLVFSLARREATTAGAVLLASKDDYHQTAATIAAKSGQTRSIHALAALFDSPAEKAAYFNIPNRFSGDRPVHTAMRHGHFETFKELVAHGADPTVANRFGDRTVDYPGDRYEEEEVRRVWEEWERGRREGLGVEG